MILPRRRGTMCWPAACARSQHALRLTRMTCTPSTPTTQHVRRTKERARRRATEHHDDKTHKNRIHENGQHDAGTAHRNGHEHAGRHAHTRACQAITIGRARPAHAPSRRATIMTRGVGGSRVRDHHRHRHRHRHRRRGTSRGVEAWEGQGGSRYQRCEASLRFQSDSREKGSGTKE